MIKIPPNLDIGYSKYKLNKGIFTGREEVEPLGKGEEEMQQRSVLTGFGYLYF